MSCAIDRNCWISPGVQVVGTVFVYGALLCGHWVWRSLLRVVAFLSSTPVSSLHCVATFLSWLSFLFIPWNFDLGQLQPHRIVSVPELETSTHLQRFELVSQRELVIARGL